MNPRSLSLSGATLVSSPDILTVLEAALGIVVRAWIGIRRGGRLTDEHRSDEPRTAGLLFRHLVRTEEAREPRKPPMKFKNEVGTHSSEEVEIPDGRIDIEIIYSLGGEPDLRLECKRVSASPEDDPKRLARYYVSGGVLRFVGDKYGRGRDLGILIAFVVDGLFEPSAELIEEYVAGYRNDPAHLCSPWRPAPGLRPRRHLFATEHRQGGGPARVRLLHLFLPFPRRTGA